METFVETNTSKEDKYFQKIYDENKNKIKDLIIDNVNNYSSEITNSSKLKNGFSWEIRNIEEAPINDLMKKLEQYKNVKTFEIKIEKRKEISEMYLEIDIKMKEKFIDLKKKSNCNIIFYLLLCIILIIIIYFFFK